MKKLGSIATVALAILLPDASLAEGPGTRIDDGPSAEARANEEVDSTTETGRTSPEIPEGKQTALGLYVTAAEAHRKWKDAPDTVKLLDVRTPEEYIFVGHAEAAVNIPLEFQNYEWAAEKGHFELTPNPEFVAQVQEWAEPTDVILVMCRSGTRSAEAVNLLAQAGFTNAFQITDGMEGDTVKNPESPHVGKRMKNGWKNAGAPWTYAVDPARVRIPVSKRGATR